MYYPKSQIKENLYTNGDELILSTTKEFYKGFYYSVSNGSAFTGKNPQDGPNIRLISNEPLSPPPIFSSNTFQDPIFVEGGDGYPLSSPKERFLPPLNQSRPTQQEKELGIFSRYFCKKNNEFIYIEIDQKTFTLLKRNDPTIAWDLYTPQIVLWQIRGDKEKTYLANKNNITLIESRQKWYGFSQYLKKDYTKYYVGV